MGEAGRLITAMVTPFALDGSVDYSQAKALAAALLDSGTDGLVVTGTTGESPTLSRDEKLRLYSTIKSHVGDRSWVIAGTGTNSTAGSIELTQAAEGTGADGALLVVPYYNKPTQEGLYQHFKAVAESTRLPCILYNVPSRTVTKLEAETVLRLSEVPNIIGIKEAGGDMAQVEAILTGVRRSDFYLWSGNDQDTFEIVRMGGYGVVAVASHLVGRQIRQMIDLCVGGHIDEARAINGRLRPLFDGLFVISNPIPVKYALEQLGFPMGGCRLPLTGPDPKSAEVVEGLLREFPIDLPVPTAARSGA